MNEKLLKNKSIEDLIKTLEEYCYSWHIRTYDGMADMDCSYECEATSWTHMPDCKESGGRGMGRGASIKDAIIECIDEMKKFGKCKSAIELDLEVLENIMDKDKNK